MIALLICLLGLIVTDIRTACGGDWPNFLGPSQNGISPETGILTDWSDGNLPLVWTYDLDTSYGIGSVADGLYYQFDRVGDSERLICLDAATGKQQWKVDQPVVYQDMYGYNNGPRSSPTISGEHVFTYGVAGRLSCHDKKPAS
ncbi:MAG: hypothetical protein R3C05_20905 [Pirellulaceae bacterium]